LIEFQARALPG